MNWEAVGAIGELGGTIVVVITLIYLARQVSQTQRSMRQQYHDNVNALFNDSLNTVASSPDLANAIAKVENGDELSPAEYVQVRSHVTTQLNGFENALLHAEEVSGVLDGPEIQRMVKNYLQLPAYRDIWEDVKAGLNPRFVAMVDSGLRGSEIDK